MKNRTQEDKSLYCVHCKRKFKNWHAVVGHLQHCNERICIRKFEIGNYRFVLYMNPLHRVVNGLKDLQKEYPDNAKFFAGSILVLKHAKFIKHYTIEKMS